jgi:hypothetical protein
VKSAGFDRKMANTPWGGVERGKSNVEIMKAES